MDEFFTTLDSFNSAFVFLADYWWVYIPPLLFFGLVGAYQNYTRLLYILGLKWILLEIKVPRDPGRSPKATEQIFIALHGIMPPPIKWRDRFFKGKVPDWFSFETVGIGGDIHFYVRMTEQYRKLVESQIYAQYPDTELIEVEDYVHGFPAGLPDANNDLWGAEFILNKADSFPIRTYPDFEEKPGGPTDVKRIDPLSSLSEVLSSLDPGEYLGVQLIIKPVGDDWIKKGQEEIDKILGKTPKVQESFITKTVFEIDKYIPGHVESKKEEKKEEKPQLTPGKTDVLKSIEHGFTKLGFQSGIRFLYASPKERFHRPHVSGVIGAFKQFSSPALNGFKLNSQTMPLGKWPFKKQQEYAKKVQLLKKFKDRSFPSKSFVLNTEELATVFHFPDISVKTPLLPRVEAKKGEAPGGLPIS
ncbi:MAG: hypothetical protein COV30_01510 [Candidatus Yanofskybacteria bacterium CG10_big_fil_rev_8_21_14_0_10_37_15]|uniref:DUF8128 domain-containing protein n=1 Tax=Candidatus Yanofskybacteria bacterium CG10_big_fil_rev_8_21_14_0_10_37_15 TaxID=1975097 RepID=A0A2H0R5U4_9BACT|nr:MAG: hypothetical protein COV30_01510 [Candidatus Yanofskybacteria bacterium CG10_big_fil_rev_8_21_14_0_10_37_15]